jgi:P4 family phage/plasmid primase-like protien
MGIFGDNAQKFWEYGLSVIPVNGKRPFTDDFQEWSFKPQTQKEIEDLIKAHGNCNIGLIMGPQSGLCAFDLDADKKFENVAPGITAISDAIKDMLIPSPCEKKGSKGFTALFKHSDLPNVSRRYMGQQIFDFISERKMIVIPPSIHPDTGKPFEWVNGINIIDVLDDLPEFPKDLLFKITDFVDSVNKNSDGNNKKSGRNEILKSYVCAIMEKHSTDEVVRLVIRKDKILHPKNPLFSDPGEFKTTEEEVNAFGFVTSIKKTIYREKGRRGEKVNTIVEQKIYPDKDFGFFKIVESRNGSTKEVPQYIELANFMKNENGFIHNESLDYIYKNNYYQSVSEDFLRNEIVKMTLDKSSPRQVSQFLQTTQDRCYKNIKEIECAFEGKINLKNGILDIKTMTLSPHVPDIFRSYILDYEFDPDADCPKTLDFLNYIFEGDKDLSAASFIPIGYSLAGGNPWLHKAFILYGEGRNGKSTYLDLIMSILGEKNFSSVSMKDIAKPFSTILMHKKLANIVEETPTKHIDAEAFKAIVGGGHVNMAFKGKDEFSAKLTARLIFACNKLPSFADFSSGLEERLCIIPFKKWIPPEERIPEMVNLLKQERSGILNRAIQEYKKVLTNKSLPRVAAIDSAFDEYKRESDSIYWWACECLEQGAPSSFLETEFLYTMFVDDMKYKVKNLPQFQSFAKRLGAVIKSKFTDRSTNQSVRLSVNNGSKRGVSGLKYNSSNNNAKKISYFDSFTDR